MKKMMAFMLGMMMLACIMTGCGGAGKGNALTDGYWIAEEMEMEGVPFSKEEMAGIFGAGEVVLTLDFGEDGSFDSVLFGEFYRGSYTGTADAPEMDFDGEKVTGSRVGDTLVLTMEGGSFTLKKQADRPAILDEARKPGYGMEDEEPEAEPMEEPEEEPIVPEEPEAEPEAPAEPEPPKTVNLTDGYWVAEKIEMDGAEFEGETMTGIFGPAESIMSLAFNGDGSFDAVLFEDFVSGTYTGTAESAELELAGDVIKGSVTDGKLVLSMPDGAFTLALQAEKPEIFGQNPWSTYDPNFDAEETMAMSNFINGGRYLVADGVLYGLTHSVTADGSLGATPFTMKGDFPEFGETVVLDENGVANYICMDGDYLYYILDFEKVCRVRTDGTGAEDLYVGSCDYLQIHEGRLYFTDEDYCLVSTDMEGYDLTTVVDKEIYYPYFIGTDWMVFQDDADDESLHLYNTTLGTEMNITYYPCYNPIMDGHYLYFTDVVEEGGNLCRVDMSDPDLYLFDRGEGYIPERYMIDDEGFYTTNGGHADKDNWKNLGDAGDTVLECYVYVSAEYRIYHKLDDEGYIAGKYLLSKAEGGSRAFP